MHAIILFSIIVWMVLLMVTFYDLDYYKKPNLPGTVKWVSDISDLGFGANKQLLIFEFDVSTIDMSDKSLRK